MINSRSETEIFKAVIAMLFGEYYVTISEYITFEHLNQINQYIKYNGNKDRCVDMQKRRHSEMATFRCVSCTECGIAPSICILSVQNSMMRGIFIQHFFHKTVEYNGKLYCTPSSIDIEVTLKQFYNTMIKYEMYEESCHDIFHNIPKDYEYNRNHKTCVGKLCSECILAKMNKNARHIYLDSLFNIYDATQHNFLNIRGMEW